MNRKRPPFDTARFAHSRKRRVAFVLNIAPHYRGALFSLLDHDTDIDFSFYVGEESSDVSSLLDMRNFLGFKGYLHNRFKKGKLVWQHGWWRPLLHRHDAYILTGNPGIRSNWLLMVMARLLGRKVYLWSHGLYGNETPKQLRRNKIYMRLASGLMLYGDHGRRMLMREGFKSERITLIYNSLDLDQQRKLRDRFAGAGFMRNIFGNDNPTIAFIGRLTPQKQLHLLIEAVGILKLSGTDVNIIFVGDGPAENELATLAQKADIEERVFFYGECYDEEMIAAILQNAVMTVSPGNVGLTAVQSLAYGVPVITHNDLCRQMPEHEAVRPDRTGDFFRHGDSLALSEKIEKWIGIMSDPDRRMQVRKNCFEMIDRRFSPSGQLMRIKRRLLADMFPPKDNTAAE